MKSTIAATVMVVGLMSTFTASAVADENGTDWAGGLYFNGGIPQGEPDDNIGSNAYGIGGQFFYSPHSSRLAIGLDLSWMNYGSEKREEPFSTTIPDVTVDVTTENNIVQGFVVLRGRMPGGPIRLYGDALLGLNYLYTETSISGTGIGQEDVVSHTNQDDFAPALGLGGGVMIPVYTQDATSEGQKPFQVLLDGGARYVRGGRSRVPEEGLYSSRRWAGYL
jgi:opacity protein-like surface antigen